MAGFNKERLEKCIGRTIIQIAPKILIVFNAGCLGKKNPRV
jgi:hypothetical protein